MPTLNRWEAVDSSYGHSEECFVIITRSIDCGLCSRQRTIMKEMIEEIRDTVQFWKSWRCVLRHQRILADNFDLKQPELESVE